ncbi:alkyl hydroperoxide reductase [Bacillus sp. V33-4]|nr:alkyl hydroperoxide reductase [Bacillus sp. V33-4]
MKALKTEVVAISTDSVYAHKVFKETSSSLRNVAYPLVSDRTQEISRAYRVLDEQTGESFRATFIISPEQIIFAKHIYPKEIGRNIPEIVRLIQGIQFAQQTGQGVPANWLPGNKGIQHNDDEIGRI